MSAKTETLVVPAKPVATYVVAVLIALGLRLAAEKPAG